MGGAADETSNNRRDEFAMLIANVPRSPSTSNHRISRPITNNDAVVSIAAVRNGTAIMENRVNASNDYISLTRQSEDSMFSGVRNNNNSP